MDNNLLEKANKAMNRLNEVYSSPTVVELRNNAPLIIQTYKELAIIEKGFQHEIDIIREERKTDLEKFKQAAPRILDNLKSILNQIFHLQEEVRELAGRMDDDPTAQTIIDYSERHIIQLLNLFQSTSYNLLNS